MKKIKVLKVLLVTLLMASTANATLITDLSERDWLVAGDKSLTYDRSTGLEWLDITITLGNSILETEASDLFGEFRWATRAEIEGLFDAVIPGTGQRSSGTSVAGDNAELFISLFADSLSTPGFVQGISRGSPMDDDPSLNLFGLGFVSLNYPDPTVNDPLTNCCLTQDETISDVGSWLVRAEVVDAPEPSTLAIFALGLMGLASRRFKKRS